jgi:hypothetical protein
MELILALALFIGMIVCWLMLPGSTTSTSVATPIAQPEVSGESRSTAGQPA